MSDRLDKGLGRHIRAVFDAYEEPFDAGNWQALQRKRRGRVFALYLRRGGVAAAIALVLAAGIVLWNRRPVANDAYLTGTVPEKDPPAAILENETPSGGVVTPDEAVAASGGQSPGEAASDEGMTIAALPETNGPEAPAPSSSPARSAPFGEAAVPATAGISGKGRKTNDALAEQTQRPIEPAQPSEERLAAEQNAVRGAEHRSGAEQQQPGAELQPGAEQQQPGAELQPGAEQQEESIAVASERSGSDVVTVPAGSADRGGRFSVGFVTTSLMNYADGNTASDVHFGAGITSGWKINDRLSVHSGLILAQNSLSLNRSNSSVRGSTYAFDRAATTEISAVGKNNIVQDVSSNGMDVNLLVVDIPLNMTYRVGVGGTNLLLTGGLSSFAYLDQEYSYHNTLKLYTNATVDASEPVIRDENAFSHFDFARQLNIAVGTELPLGDGSVLILEPYLKYPLGTLTSEHIRFGSAGMNLRFSFGSK